MSLVFEINELLCEILQYLNLYDMINLMQTCKHLLHTIGNSNMLYPYLKDPGSLCFTNYCKKLADNKLIRNSIIFNQLYGEYYYYCRYNSFIYREFDGFINLFDLSRCNLLDIKRNRILINNYMYFNGHNGDKDMKVVSGLNRYDNLINKFNDVKNRLTLIDP